MLDSNPLLINSVTNNTYINDIFFYDHEHAWALVNSTCNNSQQKIAPSKDTIYSYLNNITMVAS